MLMAWSAKKAFQEKTRRGGRWIGGMGATVTGSFCGNDGGIEGAGIASSRTAGMDGLAAIGATGHGAATGTSGTTVAVNALSWRTDCKRNS